jgi:UDP-N-acetylmuramoylalanine--D-glutamate ligase
MQTALIIGFGVSGKSSAALLEKQNRTFLAVDQNSALPGVLPEDAPLPWHEIGQLILSPGISPTHPLVERAKEQKIEVIGEIEFGFRHLAKQTCIGITGTNGKTTATLLLTHLLQSAGKKAKAVGNVGFSLTSYALAPDPEEILVVELSSFQLETLEMQCLDAAALLNITPDHLDRYAGLEEYAKAKCHIQECLKPDAPLFVFSQVLEEFGHLLHAPKRFDDEDATVVLARHFGLSEKEIAQGARSFVKPPHRIESVGEWNDITFYNDSKATNIDSVMYCMRQLKGEMILLAGGVDKGASYLPWAAAFGHRLKKCFVFGEAAAKMEEELGEHFSILRVRGMEEALVQAVSMAKPPMNIVLSPGCASFDQFRNYEHRGNEFKRMVQEKVWIEKKRS